MPTGFFTKNVPRRLLPGTLAGRQESFGVDRLALLANFEVQFYGVCSGTALFRDFLSCPDLVSLRNQQAAVMAVGTQVDLIVFHNE